MREEKDERRKACNKRKNKQTKKNKSLLKTRNNDLEWKCVYYTKAKICVPSETKKFLHHVALKNAHENVEDDQEMRIRFIKLKILWSL